MLDVSCHHFPHLLQKLDIIYPSESHKGLWYLDALNFIIIYFLFLHVYGWMMVVANI